MDFSLIAALFLHLPYIAQGDGHIAGNVQWNSSGKALTEEQVDQKYWVGPEKNRGGAFSTFRNVNSKSTMERASMKLEHPNAKECYLPLEVQVYEDLQKRAKNLLDKGFANIYDYGLYKGKRALIMSRLGSDLIEYSHHNKMPFYEWDDLRLIAKSAIDELEFLHDAGWIHQDIKPDNFMYGIEDPNKINQTENIRVSLNNRVYMIDFGAAVRYRDENGTCYKQAVANRKGTICTPPYFSRTLRKGLTQSRRDDMETLGYAMLVAGGVYLPWDDCTNKTKITKEQNRLCEELDVVSICRQSEIIDNRIQAAFSTYFFLLKKLFTAKNGFLQKPNYRAFKKCFNSNPVAYYFDVTGEVFVKSVSVVAKLLRGAAELLVPTSKRRPIGDRDLPPRSF